MKYIKSIALIIITMLISCDNNRELVKHNIDGKILFEIKNNDSIFFSYGIMDSSFYEKKNFNSNIFNNRFNFNNDITYPHLYKLSFRNERDSIPFRSGDYFIDSTTSSININSYGECSVIDGEINNEFNNVFKPYFFDKNKINCSTDSFLTYRFLNEDLFENRLYEYIEEYPDSFVALWFLIESFNFKGHTKNIEEALNLFSPKMKQSRLWNIFNKKIDNIRIKESEIFPKYILKDLDLKTKELVFPNSNYILIDFWFSRCKPCIESFPKLRNIYKEYHNKGFEIIGISVDKTKDINRWVQSINENDINWVHYLDENGIESRKDKIILFPTNFLLDENGKILKRNISPSELETLLKELNE